MPISATGEQSLLQHYKIPTLYPDTWPHPDDDDDSSDTDDDEQHQPTRKQPARHGSKLSLASQADLRRSSKYRHLDRHASIRSDTVTESVVQQDEPDALGMQPSVASVLARKGVPVQDNLKLRNRFMLSSTTFSPALFLAQVHRDASTEDLLRGLEHLSQSIEQKSASLKVLVEANFEKFVKAKATIDNVYTEMRMQGAEAEGQQQQQQQQQSQQQTARDRRHSRVTSRNSTAHFRNTSGAFSAKAAAGVQGDKKKNALTKESEYGVQGIKTPLVEVAIKAEEVWGPALGGREKEETLKGVLGTLEQHRDIFRLSGELRESVRKGDYDNIVEAYKQAKKHRLEATSLADNASQRGMQLDDAEAQQIILTAKMWRQVEGQIEEYKREVWRKLKNSHGRKSAAVADETDKEQHMELIGILLQLGVDENPIWEWLNSRYLYLKDKIARSFERSRIEIEIQRRRLGNEAPKDAKTLAKYLRSVANTSVLRFAHDSNKDIDSPAVLALWEKVQSALEALLSSSTGILGEVLEYWETAQAFIDNRAQKAFLTAVFAAGLEHLELEPDDVQNLRQGAADLVALLRDSTAAFFSDAPVDDLSELYSPIPPTPKTATTTGPPTPNNSTTLSPSSTTATTRAFTFDPSTLPPPSPRRGDPWETYAFWPPTSNTLSGSHHLATLLALVGTAATEMAALPVVAQLHGAEPYKHLVNCARERGVQAVCAAWHADAERCKWLETWARSPERRDLTGFPAGFAALEERVLGCVQQMAYVTGASGAGVGAGAGAKGGNGGSGFEVVLPPSAKVLQAIRGAFVASLYKALSGMVENAEKGVKRDGREGESDPDGVVVSRVAAGKGGGGGEGVVVAVDAGNRNIRLLLSLSNLAHLRHATIPHLIAHFETLFSVKLTDESKTIRDVLGQIDARLFQSYVRPTVEHLDALIKTGIADPGWEPPLSPSSGGGNARPNDAKPYIYDVLLHLVLIHAEATAAAPALVHSILSHHLEACSHSLIAAFAARSHYTLPALMQATLDVEFLAQTLNQYTTDRAGEVQSRIYLALDERTDDQARARLQGELPGMRAVLKGLREGTRGGFGCFRRVREAGGGGTGRGRGGSRVG